MNANLQKGRKISVIVGSGVIGVGAAVEIFKSGGEVKKWAMPAVTLLVAVSAFTYAMSGQEVTLVPKA